MVLDARLKKLASGVPAEQVVRAHTRSQVSGEALSDVERQQADEFKATVEAMFLMAAVDGEISDVELEQLKASIQAIVDMHVVESMPVGPTLAELNDRLARDGWQARLDAVVKRIRSPEGKAFAFRLASGVAFADDHVVHAEAAAIDALAGGLGLGADESQAIMREVHAELFGG